MAAPSGTIWGNIITGSKSTRKGRIGIYVGVSTSDTQVTVNIQTYFWSMYSIYDVNNSYYYNVGTSATTLIGSRTINHTVNTGSGWSTSNQTKLGESTYTYERKTSAYTMNYAAKITGLDNLGSSSVTSVGASVTIPALASYTVSYNANGGSGAPSNQTKYYGKNITLSSTKPSRTGYSFQGWGTSASDTSVDYSPGGTYSSNSSITLYAIWKANTYTVSYNANGGSGAPSNQTKTYGVNLTLSKTVPTRKYYNFLGWSTSASATKATYSAGGTYTYNDNVTLYAVWKLAYVKPRITNLNVVRCDAFGAPSSNGEKVLVTFDWACDMEVTDIQTLWAISGNGGYDNVIREQNISGTSGSVSRIISRWFDPDISYKFRIEVTDSESSIAFAIIPGSTFVIDAFAGGNGVAFGKKAQIAEMIDCAWPIYPRKGFVFTFLDNGTDLNTVTNFGIYHGGAATNYGYVNCPITANNSFTLEVLPAGNNGQIIQRLTSCSKTAMHIWHRHYYTSSWGDWIQTY